MGECEGSEWAIGKLDEVVDVDGVSVMTDDCRSVVRLRGREGETGG